MKLHRRLLASVLILLLSPMSANAVPITFTFDMPAFTVGTLAGSTSVLEVTADNGGTSLLNQVFLNTQITELSTDLTGDRVVPFYYQGSAIYITTDSQGIASLAPQTGPSGAVTGVQWFDGLQGISLGTPRDGVYSVQQTTGPVGVVYSPYPITSVPSQVSEPGTLALLAIGVGCMYRRRTSKSRV